MASNLPILIFPEARVTEPPRGQGFPPSYPPSPSRRRQIERIDSTIRNIASDFDRYRGMIESSMGGVEPEMVLVLELANRIEDFVRAVEAAGLEWLAEWDIEIDGDEDFPVSRENNTRDGRLFVSMVNQQGMNELLRLWNRWKHNRTIPHGKTKWRDMFECLKNIRRWGVEETLVETGVKAYFDSLLDSEIASFQIECFYHRNQHKRRNVERHIRELLSRAEGEAISDFIDMPDIAFHAIKAKMPVVRIRQLLSDIETNEAQPHLFVYPSVMYFRPTGQQITSLVEGDGIEAQYETAEADAPPVAAILDGVPNTRHKALEGHVIFDDPFDLASAYAPGERRHGTAMASLVVHGDRSEGHTQPLLSKVLQVAVMQVDDRGRKTGRIIEHFPEDCFIEDRIERAVRRIFENDGEVEAQAPTTKIINLSLGDPTRPFIFDVSPWARLLDWLSWKYRVLFCVSAGNFGEDYDLGIPFVEYDQRNSTQKSRLLLRKINASLTHRRLFSPAESINAITVGSCHLDGCGNGFDIGHRIDLQPNNWLPSPVSRLGHGFRRSVKPELYLPGGRQLYNRPATDTDSCYSIDESLRKPGQKTAWDSRQEGEQNKDVFTRGTSNATALATRAGVMVFDVLKNLQIEERDEIPENLISIVIKTLLVHGCIHDRAAQIEIESLKDRTNRRQFKTVLARYLGFGSVDVQRVLSCTEQRGTAIGFGEIDTDSIHEYRFPVPNEFSGQRTFRRMVVTLAWFSPINPKHRYLREAKLDVSPSSRWIDSSLKLERTDGDHNQVKRGTVQHEVLEGEDLIRQFLQEEEIVLKVQCRKDATDNLEEKIPYGLAVTLEAAEGSQIPVYESLRIRLAEEVPIEELP